MGRRIGRFVARRGSREAMGIGRFVVMRRRLVIIRLLMGGWGARERRGMGDCIETLECSDALAAESFRVDVLIIRRVFCSSKLTYEERSCWSPQCLPYWEFWRQMIKVTMVVTFRRVLLVAPNSSLSSSQGENRTGQHT